MLICGECKQPFTNLISYSAQRVQCSLDGHTQFVACLDAKVFVQLYVVNSCRMEESITIFVNLGLIRHFETVTNIRTWIKLRTQILENVVRCKYFEAGVHINNPTKNSYQDGLGRTSTRALDHVVVVHILI
jgi:hypothetical protein